MIKTVFFGSSSHSVTVLQKLLTLSGFNVASVVTKEDKPVGRSQVITPNPVALFARQQNLPLYQPSEFDDQFIAFFRSLSCELCLCVAYGPPYFTPEMCDIPKYGIVNIHPSPLPKYRGATPGPWQIINGETTSAVTFFKIDPLPDHGPIIASIPFKIDKDETALSFYEKAFSLAVSKLEEVLTSYTSNPELLTPQDHTQKSYFPKFDKEKAQIDWSKSALDVNRFIRALNPWPIAWTYVKNPQGLSLKMKVFSSQISGSELVPNEVQIEGKQKTSWKEVSLHYKIQK